MPGTGVRFSDQAQNVFNEWHKFDPLLQYNKMFPQWRKTVNNSANIGNLINHRSMNLVNLRTTSERVAHTAGNRFEYYFLQKQFK